MRSNIPKFAWVAIVVAFLSLILVTAVAWRVDLLGRDEEQRDCKRAVAAREDNRTMWLYILATAADAKPSELEAFRVELDKRLPALECHDADPVPVSLARSDA